VNRSSPLLVLAALVVIVAGLKAVASVAVPTVLAFLVVAAVSPLIAQLDRRAVPRWLSLPFVVLVVAAGAMVLTSFVVSSLQDFVADLPDWENRLANIADSLVARFGPGVIPGDLSEVIDAGSVMRYAGTALTALVGVASNVLIIMLIVVFFLLEATGIRAKLDAVFPAEVTEDIYEAAGKIQRYLGVKTVISALTGCLVFVLDLSFGLDYPLLWAVLAFALNFIPNVGSVVAGVPATLLALVQLGWGPALGIALGYLIINTVVGSLLEPRIMGGQLGLSPLVIFLSLLFWNYIWGPAGMLISVPMMVALRIALESYPATRPIAILIGPSSAVQGTAAEQAAER
jgi:predicted PurR-regulated permease PerM